MGQYNTKNEEVVIAQAGVGQQIDEMKGKVELYGALLGAVTGCVTFIILYVCCKRCTKLTGKWFKNQMKAQIGSAIVLQQPTCTSVRTEPPSSPTKVIFS